MVGSPSTLRPGRASPEPSLPLRRLAADAPRLVAKGLFAAADLFLGPWPGPRLLIYHQVRNRPGRQMELSPGMFARHLGWLEKRGRIVRLEQALADVEGPDADRTFVLTFDDGYQDVFHNAFPLLRDGGIPFTLYLATESIETGAEPAPGATPISWDQVGEMMETGLVTLGSHTHRHRDLRGLTPEQVEEELATSDELVELRTGERPRHFAYPKGYWDPVADGLVRSRYETATLGAGPPLTGHIDPHRLYRIPVQRSDGHFFFTRKAVKGMRLEETVRSRLRGYRHPPSG